MRPAHLTVPFLAIGSAIDRRSAFKVSRHGVERVLTADEERWAEALAIERLHGDSAVAWIVERVTDLAAQGDDAGVARFLEIAARLDQLMIRGAQQ